MVRHGACMKDDECIQKLIGNPEEPLVRPQERWKDY
jgi:hypothetical protein